MNPPPRFWLKSEKGLLVQVSTVGYENDSVGKFVDAIVTSKVRRAQLGLPEGPDPTLTLHIMETADALRDDLPLADILMQPGYGENSAEKPLVVVIKVEQQSKHQRFDNSVEDRQISREESSSFRLLDLFLENSGLEMKLPRTLFCRSEFWKQFEFLDKVLHTPRPESKNGENPYYNGWILGSPGTGKSKTTLAFMSTIDRVHWAITWIHLSSVDAACYQVVDNDNRILHKRRLESPPEHIRRIILEEPDVNRHHIMVVDGIWNDEPHRQVRSICLDWVQEKYEERRLVFVSSMASRGKAKPVEDSRFGAEEFAVDSWNLDDYIHAVKNDDFYNDIQEMLDASGCENLRSREDLLKSKYFFAGGCPRLMFDYKTAKVMQILQSALSAVGDLMACVKNFHGKRSEDDINMEFIFAYDVKCRMRLASFISKYAATLVAKRKGPEIIKGLTGVLSEYLNPSMRGWLVEMWFFASLPAEDFKFEVNGEETTWPKSTFIDFDPRSITEVPNDAVWWKPIKWNEGGYDAVYVNKNSNLVRFVQVTTAERHSLKLECFHTLMDKLKGLMETKTLEIYFLFQDKGGLSQNIGEPKEVSGKGLLEAFSGWERGKEWSHVRKGLFECPIPDE
ncbi:unnamed protein product [Calypogeia fissa]